MCVTVLPTRVCIYHVHAWCPQRPEEDIDPLELQVQTGGNLPCDVFAGNGPLVEDQVLLTTDPFL